jgi:hypothetical protein
MPENDVQKILDAVEVRIYTHGLGQDALSTLYGWAVDEIIDIPYVEPKGSAGQEDNKPLLRTRIKLYALTHAFFLRFDEYCSLAEESAIMKIYEDNWKECASLRQKRRWECAIYPPNTAWLPDAEFQALEILPLLAEEEAYFRENNDAKKADYCWKLLIGSEPFAIAARDRMKGRGEIVKDEPLESLLPRVNPLGVIKPKKALNSAAKPYAPSPCGVEASAFLWGEVGMASWVQKMQESFKNSQEVDKPFLL